MNIQACDLVSSSSVVAKTSVPFISNYKAYKFGQNSTFSWFGPLYRGNKIKTFVIVINSQCKHFSW
jgi:hypothetical protein